MTAPLSHRESGRTRPPQSYAIPERAGTRAAPVHGTRSVDESGAEGLAWRRKLPGEPGKKTLNPQTREMTIGIVGDATG